MGAGVPMGLNYEQELLEDYCAQRPKDCADEIKPAVVESVPDPNCCGKKVEYPPLAQQAVSLARDLGKWIKAGFPRSTRELVARRLSICVNCEYWSGKVQSETMRCRKCGCRMKLKVGMATAKCPIGKW
jgi:hypothetical protein